MVRLRELPRTATFAWSPGADKPLLVTGTRAGAVDADFSDESKLELWDLALDDQQQGLELQPVASITTESKYVHTRRANSLIETLIASQVLRHCLGTSRFRPPAGYHCWRIRKRITRPLRRRKAHQRCFRCPHFADLETHGLCQDSSIQSSQASDPG